MAILETLLALKGAAMAAAFVDRALMPTASRYMASKRIMDAWESEGGVEAIPLRATREQYDEYIRRTENAANGASQAERDAEFEKADELLQKFNRQGVAFETVSGRKR